MFNDQIENNQVQEYVTKMEPDVPRCMFGSDWPVCRLASAEHSQVRVRPNRSFLTTFAPFYSKL